MDYNQKLWEYDYENKAGNYYLDYSKSCFAE